MTSRFVIGVDGGGTGCRVLIKDVETGQTASGEGGPANVATDFDSAVRNVRLAIKQASRTFALGQDGIYQASAHIGLAGVYGDRITEATRRAFPFKQVSVSDDRAGAVEGFLQGKDGYLVVAGTGMIVASSKAGKQRFVGGHGFQVSDHGSGAWLGRQVLDVTLRRCDGIGAQSDLTQEIMTYFGSDPRSIVTFSLASGPAQYARLAPKVIAAAQADDPNALAIMETGARHITDGLHALGFGNSDTLCLAGGIGPHYLTYLAPDMIGGLILPEGSALEGALRLAIRLRASKL